MAKLRGSSESGRSSYRAVWWMRFWLPPIAVLAWLYFGASATDAYVLARDGVVVSGEVIKTDTFPRTDYMIVRFTTPEGRQVEERVEPKNCDVRQPGETIKVRYLPSAPGAVQDTCDPPRRYISWGAFLVALVTTAASVQAWRLWWRHRKARQIPAEHFA